MKNTFIFWKVPFVICKIVHLSYAKVLPTKLGKFVGKQWLFVIFAQVRESGNLVAVELS